MVFEKTSKTNKLSLHFYDFNTLKQNKKYCHFEVMQGAPKN